MDGARIVTAPRTPTAVIARATSWEEFPRVWRTLLDEVWAFLRGSNLAPGRNVMLYKDDAPNVEVGVEVTGSFTGGGNVVSSSLPAGQAVTAIARGAPSAEGLARAHAAVKEWSAANGHKLTGVRWEIYGHWLEDQDPAQYETEVYWLLESEAAP
jgi:effector-binding domain-containing protein